MRLFVAVQIPEAHRVALAAASATLRDMSPRARWERPEKLHLTLSFLGEVGADRIEALASALHGAVSSASPFTLRLGAAGAFPNPSRARVLWIGVEGDGALTALQERVAAAVAPFAERRDGKPFHAHLTLARCDPPWSASGVARFAERLSGVAPEPFRVEAVALVESELGRGGSRYREVARVDLAGGAS